MLPVDRLYTVNTVHTKPEPRPLEYANHALTGNVTNVHAEKGFDCIEMVLKAPNGARYKILTQFDEHEIPIPENVMTVGFKTTVTSNVHYTVFRDTEPKNKKPVWDKVGALQYSPDQLIADSGSNLALQPGSSIDNALLQISGADTPESAGDDMYILVAGSLQSRTLTPGSISVRSAQTLRSHSIYEQQIEYERGKAVRGKMGIVEDQARTDEAGNKRFFYAKKASLDFVLQSSHDIYDIPRVPLGQDLYSV